MFKEIKTNIKDIEKLKEYVKKKNIDKCSAHIEWPQGSYVLTDIVYFKDKIK